MSESNDYINSALITLKVDKGLDVYISACEKLFLFAQDNVCILDPHGKLVYRNPTLVELCDTYANTDAEAAWNGICQKMSAQMIRAMDTRTSTSFFFECEGASAQYHVNDLIHISPIIDMQDQVLGVIAIGRDHSFYEQIEGQEIRRREYYLRALLDTFPFMVWMKDKNSRFLACNNAFAKVAQQISVHDLEGRTDYDYFSVEAAASYIADDRDVMQTGVSKTLVEPIVKNNGEIHWAETFKSCVVINDEVIGTVGFARDISKEQYLQAQVTKRQQDYMTLVKNLPITIVRYDLKCKRIFVSTHCEGLHGVLGDSYLLKTPEEAWSPYILNLTAKEFTRRLEAVIQTEKKQSFEIHTKYGESFSVNQVKLIPEYDENRNVTGVLTIATDITENAEYRQTIEHLAFHDVLTGLPNRRFFNQALNKAIERAEQNQAAFAVFIMDLDHFKTINDTMGHDVGDQLLIDVANRIKQNTGESYFFARMGGDEFAILIHGYEFDEDLIAKSTILLEQVFQPYYIAGAGYFVSASIGVACYPKDSHDVDDLIKYADSAMYSAKQKGGNNCQLYSPALTQGMRYRLAIETALRYAMINHELYPEFQPIVDMQTKRLIGVEILCRWKSATLGQVSPTSFIQVAEQSGIIVEIGYWIIKQGFIAAKIINEASAEVVSVSINLSSRQFIEINFLQRIKSLLDETKCKPAWIKFEITEGLLLQDAYEVHRVLDAFDEMGFRISIDDFGTGYSALAYLNKFPIHQVKIDRSFINEMTTNHNHALLVKAIVAMVQSLGKELVAEGVETEAQASLLQSYGCQYAQGFLFSKSVGLENLMLMLKK
ncbi:MAG: EAL domain-containing protein [Methylotenera sp.]|uniref:EAL domain-containing protein n=1 Tax=Methylotenera sp. TaxID=2051956 RepID=UPI0024898C71|nr:EAL domain-containing protein [Methylotenera sp.]MDI1309077.1 EAL domain-containing protein [Methylotenera sp.]